MIDRLNRQTWFLAGLFFTTLSTLTLEVLNTRLLSVITWYHLSFFAVSVAMLGMAVGAVHVYLGGERFSGQAAVTALARYSLLFAVSVPLSHLFNISIPILTELSANTALTLLLSTAVLGVPFYLSGVVVSLALTRLAGPIGIVYGVDLLGAALGCLLVLPLLDMGNITSAVFGCGALAVLGAACFRKFANVSGLLRVTLFSAVLLAAAMVNSLSEKPLRVLFAKGAILSSARVLEESWSLHGQVVAYLPALLPPPYWDPGQGAPLNPVESIFLTLDGGAGTTMTRWNGSREALNWTRYDVTALPYHLRPGGDVGIIGVGGGCDILAALSANSRSVTGIEINRTFIDLLQGRLRDFAHIVDHPGVKLLHDEARSYLTREQKRFDVLQMSLIDTWAATGAGAFTLTENGLYTVEAWEVFLKRVKPGGVFSVSRWYAQGNVSETSRLVALATAALLRIGAKNPAEQLVLLSRTRIATLLLTNRPFSSLDLSILKRVADQYGYTTLLAPHNPPATALLGKIIQSRSPSQIDASVKDEPYDYTPPTDDRPYFFNLVKPAHSFDLDKLNTQGTGVISGNILATTTLLVLLLIVVLLVIALILVPLLRSGFPRMGRTAFGFSVGYFALIGAGFMLIQIGLIQRLSVYLGYPTYAVSVVLFSMILATGAGSLLSDRAPVETSRYWVIGLPLIASAVLLSLTLALQTIINQTIGLGLFARCLISVTAVALISLPLGMFFPAGLRLVRRLSDDALPWMWGVNGAAGVLAGVLAVVVSMWLGIRANLLLAVGGYFILVLPMLYLWNKGRGLSGKQ